MVFVMLTLCLSAIANFGECEVAHGCIFIEFAGHTKSQSLPVRMHESETATMIVFEFSLMIKVIENHVVPYIPINAEIGRRLLYNIVLIVC